MANGAALKQMNTGLLIFLSILTIILGTVAVIIPQVATIAVEQLIGWIFVFYGGFRLVRSFRDRGKVFLLSLVVGLLFLGAGVILLAYPLAGAMSLTLFLALLIMAEGIVEIILSFNPKPASNWGWVLFSGIVSLILSYMIWISWPSSALWAIGLLVGINLIFSGWATLIFALAARKSGPGGLGSAAIA